MGTLIGIAALAAVLAWLLGPARRRPAPAPEDDVGTPLDAEELAAAERELEGEKGARPLHEGFDDDQDDWGPGTR